MAWSALSRKWNNKRKKYDTLILRIDDTPEPGCLLRLYDGKAIAGEALAESPPLAMTKALELARAYVNDSSITEESLRCVQMR